MPARERFRTWRPRSRNLSELEFGASRPAQAAPSREPLALRRLLRVIGLVGAMPKPTFRGPEFPRVVLQPHFLSRQRVAIATYRELGSNNSPFPLPEGED